MKLRITYAYLLLAILLSSGGILVHGQVQSPGKIMGDFRNLKAAELIYLLPPLHPLQVEACLQENTEHYNKPLVFAIERPVSIAPATQGLWTQTDEYRIWRAHIITTGAVSVGLIFDAYRLEEGVKLMIYNPDKTFVKGAYTSLNNKSSGIFAVAHIPGDELIIELQVPVQMEDYGELSLGSLSHAFLPVALNGTRDGRFGRSQPCEIDISCEEGTQWQLEKRSVVRLYTVTQYCTGVMLNNTAYNGDPLLLTAEHCIENESRAESSVFVFNYESPSCFGADGSVAMSISGSELLSVGDSIDFSLVRLSLPPPEEFDVYYAGWDLTTSPSGPTTTIHHPEGDVKKITFDFDAPDSTFKKSQIAPQFWDLLSNSFWWIKQWDIGSTEPGSSGSPLFTPTSHVIGVLSWGSAKCGDSIGYDGGTDRVEYDKTNNVDDYYTRLDVAWDYRSDSAQSLKPWLDPAGTGVRIIDGLHPGSIPENRPILGSDFTAWPNPAGSELWFSARTSRNGSVKYRVFDLRGALLLEGEAGLPGPVLLNISDLPGGLYLLSLIHGPEQEILKFVKTP